MIGSFLFGIFLASLAEIPKWLWLSGFGLSLILILAFWPRPFQRHPSSKGLRDKDKLTERGSWRYVFYAFALFAFMAGGMRMQTASSTSILTAFARNEAPALTKGYISAEVQHSPSRQQFRFVTKEVELSDRTRIFLSENTLVVTTGYPKYNYGDTLQIRGRIELPKNTSEFDYAHYLATSNVFTIMKNPEILPEDIQLDWIDRAKLVIMKGVFKFKGVFESSIENAVTEPNGAYLNGILLGSRGDIPDSLKDDFKKTGTSHILAISGYNITILAGVISWLLVLFLRRQTAFWVSVAAVLLFTVLTGASASVVRAALMGILVLLAGNVGRVYDSRNALMTVAGVMVLANPFVLKFDVGFQLSFLATIGIIYVVPFLEPYARKIPEGGKIRETFLMTLSAQIMVIPLLLFYFHSLSVVSLLTNLLILFFVPYAMLLGFITGIAGLFSSSLSMAIGWLAWVVTSYQINVIHWLAGVPFSSLSFNFPWYLMLILYALLLVFFIRLARKKVDAYERT